ncbi:MAG: mechanosensitive ion channel family protein [Promethearchaeota archaeon]
MICILQQVDFSPLISFIESLSPIVITITVFIAFLFSLWFVGRILKFFIRRTKRIPTEARNGVRNFISILQIFIGFVGIALIFDVDPQLIVNTSTLVATAIGFASTSIAANVVGGLYLIITRPFGVGDFISAQGNEGIVIEIGLLYTEVMQLNKTVVTIPNSNLLTASVLNSNIILRKDESTEKKEKRYSIPGFIGNAFREPFRQKEIVRYTTKIEVTYSVIDPPLTTKELENRLTTTLKEISNSLFGYPIEYYFGAFTFRQEVYFIITATDANQLFDNYSQFLEQIWRGIFPELGGGASK